MLNRDKLFSCYRLSALPAVFVAGTCLAQSDLSSIASDSELLNFDTDRAKQEYRNPKPRELTVLTETLSAEQIDRAVLNRLMQEINSSPANTKARIGINDSQLQELFITISNARGFINGSELANVRALCAAWDESTASGEARIVEAIAAYKTREQLTQTFIAKYYSVVLFDIEAFLDEKSLPLFRAYMSDRRRRLANAGMTSGGSPVQNISAGTDTIDFHCRTN
ncbi:MAG: hypothetical protein COB20_00640 [SAR86 cluster bacterium]|uniref:Uncharacterized protein n=1 Tax=SAR86 cluster bacterium TaxID=2030880 RepID=A0A2A4XHM6_9GAMM|nr:MAG: hypothetical protein COB20_00640 [SAR86 cluster bacterium]